MVKIILKKTIRYILLGVIAIFVGYIVVIGTIFAHNFAYEKTDCYPRSAPHIMPFFDDSVSNQIIISALHTDIFDDSMCVFNYKKYGLFVWTIKQYKNTFLLSNIDTIQKEHDVEQIVFYTHLPVEGNSLISINSKQFLYKHEQIAISFYDCKNIQYVRHSTDYQYYHLKASLIYLISPPHNYYDAYISMANYTDMDFLIKRFDDKIYIIGMYSLDNKDVSEKDLLNILRKNFL